MSNRLTEQLVAQLPADVVRPRYDRSQLKPGIVHLGVGAFHRAHQAWYTEQVLNREGGDWGIIGVSLRSAGVRDQLQPQQGLYTVVERDGDQRRCQVIGAISRVLVAPENPQQLIEQLSHPDIRVITLTVTEKGYCYDHATQALNSDDPDVQRDIASFPQSPTTAIAYLVASLALRAERGDPGVTLLSCDNLPHNGHILRKVVLDLASKVDPALPGWIETNVTFPCSMVDRIVPATSNADLEKLQQGSGVRDEAAVFTEPFSQWVVEDDFIRGAPDWQAVGAQFTNDVTPFETMKLRLLNGSHSLIAYLGYLMGYEYVHEVMADQQLSDLVRLYMDRQVQSTLTIPAGFDIDDYKTQLCQRFANSALNHRTYQIAQDGSQKIPQRWLASVRELEQQGERTDILSLAVAGWIRFLQGRRESGELFVVDDPLAERLQLAAAEEEPCRAVMGVVAVFGEMLTENPVFVQAVNDSYQQFSQAGISAAVGSVINAVRV